MSPTKSLESENRGLRRRLSLALSYLSNPELKELETRLAGHERRQKWAQAHLTDEHLKRITIPVTILPPAAPVRRLVGKTVVVGGVRRLRGI